MQHQVHRAHARRALHQLPAAKGAVFQVALLVAGEVGVVLRQVLVRGEQKAAGAAGRIADHLARPARDAIHHRLNERARREVLAGAGLDVLRVALQQALVGVALHVGAHRRPVFRADQVNDHAPQLGRVLTISSGDWTPAGRPKGEPRRKAMRIKLVLRLAKDQRQCARLLAQLFQRVAVVVEQRIAVEQAKRRPRVGRGDGARLVVRRAAALVGHLEEQQVGELLDVVAIAHPVVAQDVAVVPELLDEGGGVHRDRSSVLRPTV